MQPLLKTLFWFSVCFISFILLMQLLLHVLPVQFATQADEDFFSMLTFAGLPIAVLITLVHTIKRADSIGAVVSKIVLTIFVAIMPVLIAFSTALDLCGWSIGKVLFVKKNDPSTKIVLREFGCGAVDAASPAYSVVQVKYFTAHFIIVSNIDTATINRAFWLRSNN